MSGITYNLIANQQDNLPYGASILPSLQQKQRLLSSQDPARPSFCPLTGLGSTFLNPFQQAGYICSGNDVYARNSTAASQQILAHIDGSYIDLNCTHNTYGSNVTTELLSCHGADSFYQHEAKTSDLEMLASWWWSPKCCSPKEDIQKIWRAMFKEYRMGPNGKNGIVIKGVMSMISTISSVTFIWMLRRSYDGFSTTQNRVLLGLCVSDIIYSFTFLHFGTLVPKEVDYFSWNAKGNMGTCQLDGFFSVVGGMGPFYNASLCVLLLAIVKYEKSDEYIRNKIEPFLHAVPILISFGYYIVCLLMDGINPSGAGNCNMSAPYSPPHCFGMEDGSMTEGLFDIPCGRGNAGGEIALRVGLCTIILPPIVMITCLAMIYRWVLISEQKMSKYGASSMSTKETSSASKGVVGLLKQYLLLPFSSYKKSESMISSTSQHRRTKRPSHSRLVMYKGVAYSCSWLISWGFFYILIFIYVIGAKAPVALSYAVAVLLPLQGLFNLAIHMHPKILAAKRSKRENLSWWEAFSKAFWSKGVRGGKMKGGRSVPSKTRRYESDSCTMKSSNVIPRAAVGTRSLRSKRQRSTEGGENEEKQEIEAPRDLTYLSFGRRTNASTRFNPTPPVPLYNSVVEDNKIKIGDKNENDLYTFPGSSITSVGKEEISECIEPIVVEGKIGDKNGHDLETIPRASITSVGKEEISECIEPIMVEGSSHGVLYNGHDGHDSKNDEEKVLSKTEIVANDDDQSCDGSNWEDRHADESTLEKGTDEEHRK